MATRTLLVPRFRNSQSVHHLLCARLYSRVPCVDVGGGGGHNSDLTLSLACLQPNWGGKEPSCRLDYGMSQSRGKFWGCPKIRREEAWLGRVEETCMVEDS